MNEQGAQETKQRVWFRCEHGHAFWVATPFEGTDTWPCPFCVEPLEVSATLDSSLNDLQRRLTERAMALAGIWPTGGFTDDVAERGYSRLTEAESRAEAFANTIRLLTTENLTVTIPRMEQAEARVQELEAKAELADVMRATLTHLKSLRSDHFDYMSIELANMLNSFEENYDTLTPPATETQA